jgi:hypothetical protein
MVNKAGKIVRTIHALFKGKGKKHNEEPETVDTC